MKYRADIDGLRTLAVLPVVLFHSGLVLFSGGFVGVDIFFVISGFLITSIIRDDIEAGRFSILKFYERRARRILPALMFMTVLTSIFIYILFLPNYLIDFAKSMLSMALFVSNMYFWKFSGYFDSSAQLRPFLHTWSLSVEEQFYIFMPVAMLLLYRFRSSVRMTIFILAAVASLALSILATSVAPTANFFLLPTRSWELLCGALLAIGRPAHPKSPMLVNALALLGLAGVLVPVFVYTESTPFPGFAALPPCLGAALLIYTGQDSNSFIGRILSTAPFVGIGRISYSLYLAHWPVVVILRYVTLREPTLMDATVIIVLSFALAVFSWRYVERPFRTPELVKSRGAVFSWSAASLGFLCLVSVGTIMTKGLPGRYPGFNSRIAAVSGEASGTDGVDLTWRNGTCFFENDEHYKDWKPEPCVLNPGMGNTTLLWGDSYAAHYIPGLVLNQAALGAEVYLYTYAGCPPIFAYKSYARVGCSNFNQRVLALIDELKIKNVVLSARWIDLRHRGLDLLGDTIKELKDKGVQVTVIGHSPLFVTDVKVIDFRKSEPTEMTAAWPSVVREEFNETLRRNATGADLFIDPLDHLCKNDLCTYKAGGKLLYGDEGHFSREGSAGAVADYMAPLALPAQ